MEVVKDWGLPSWYRVGRRIQRTAGAAATSVEPPRTAWPIAVAPVSSHIPFSTLVSPCPENTLQPLPPHAAKLASLEDGLLNLSLLLPLHVTDSRKIHMALKHFAYVHTYASGIWNWECGYGLAAFNFAFLRGSEAKGEH